MKKFIHLHTHSEYSLIDGIVRIKPLIKHCQAEKISAIAITDHCNIFAAVKFYKAATQAGIKPILGAELKIASDDPKITFNAVLLCMNNTGYANLIKIISLSYTKGQASGEPVIQRDWILENNEGLIMLSGSIWGDIGQALLKGNPEQAVEYCKQWQAIFHDRFYLELTRTGQQDEKTYLESILPIAKKLSMPVVATNNVRFIKSDDFAAHEARVCIREGYVLDDKNRPQLYTDQQYLRSEQEMETLFEDIPSALQNSVEISKRCNVHLQLGRVCLPNFKTPDGSSVEDYLRKSAKEGLEKRLLQLFDASTANDSETRKRYFDRLALELDAIIAMGFTGYFLIVADFIHWSMNNGVPVGPGRGSGAGSLVAYSLKITDIDPLQYDLLFERFINPERVSMPDFDIDFCMAGRDRVIEYVAEKYGRESVSQIITFGTMAAKAVVRDVGRVLGFPYGFVDKIAKLIPFEVGMTLDKALTQEEQLLTRYKEEEEVRNLIDLAKKLEGVARNAGKHAGGVVISPSLLTDFSALYCEPGSSQVVTQFDKDDVEAIGLVKFDFLGLRTLTIIAGALQIINNEKESKNEALVDITKIPMDDAGTFELLKACETTGIFQLESRGMKDLIKRLQPDCFEDIIQLGALFRPGPLQSGMVDDFINRRHGREAIEYPHEALAPVLKPTYGVILYQEQVMQIAQVLAGFTLGGADMLRRAMGKKKQEEMDKQRALFIVGAAKNNVTTQLANDIFDLMDKFAGYGFNKSHSAAYAYISYQTAWLKRHYPAAFMAAVLTSEMDHTDKVVIFVEESRRMKLIIEAPNINTCQYTFTVKDEKTILYGLGAIKGAGEAAIELMIQERENHGNYADLFDLCARVDARKINKRVLEALISAGAMDCFGIERAMLFASVDNALKYSDKKSADKASGQADMFGMLSHDSDVQAPKHEYTNVPAWSAERRLLGEKESLGLYFSGHPLDCVAAELQHFVTAPLHQINLEENKTITVAGLVTAVRTLFTKRGDRMAFLTLSDQNGVIESAVFSDVFEAEREKLVKDNIIILEAEVSYDANSSTFKLSAKRILSIEQARLLYAKTLLLNLDQQQVNQKLIADIQRILTPFTHGHCPVTIHYQSESAKAKLHLDQAWWVEPTDQLLQELRQMLGNTAVEVCY